MPRSRQGLRSEQMRSKVFIFLATTQFQRRFNSDGPNSEMDVLDFPIKYILSRWMGSRSKNCVAFPPNHFPLDRRQTVRQQPSPLAAQKKAPRSCDLGAKSTKGEVEETIGAQPTVMLRHQYSRRLLHCSNQLWLRDISIAHLLSSINHS